MIFYTQIIWIIIKEKYKNEEKLSFFMKLNLNNFSTHFRFVALNGL